jgi:hypothetical protein
VAICQQFVLSAAPASASIAGAKDFKIMTDFSKAVSRSDCIGPPLDRRSRYLDRPTADAAHQVMMVTGRAATVCCLTVIGPNGIKIARVGHQLQGPINRGQANAFAVMS